MPRPLFRHEVSLNCKENFDNSRFGLPYRPYTYIICMKPYQKYKNHECDPPIVEGSTPHDGDAILYFPAQRPN